VPPMIDGRFRRSYVLWQEAVRPLVIIEYASGDGSEERDTAPHRGKFWVYEKAICAGYYAIYEVEKAAVELFKLNGGCYVRVEPNAAGRLPIEPLGVELESGTASTVDWSCPAYVSGTPPLASCCRLTRSETPPWPTERKRRSRCWTTPAGASRRNASEPRPNASVREAGRASAGAGPGPGRRLTGCRSRANFVSLPHNLHRVRTVEEETRWRRRRPRPPASWSSSPASRPAARRPPPSNSPTRGTSGSTATTAGGAVDDLLPRLGELLDAGKSVVMDNLYATRASRAGAVAVARKHKARVRCMVLDTGLEDAQFNACLRMMDRCGKVLRPRTTSRSRTGRP